jgi:hypothetical protein
MAEDSISKYLDMDSSSDSKVFEFLTQTKRSVEVYRGKNLHPSAYRL